MQYTWMSHKHPSSNLRTNKKTLTKAVNHETFSFEYSRLTYIKEYYSYLPYLQRYSAGD